jgi:hypothetical protein
MSLPPFRYRPRTTLRGLSLICTGAGLVIAAFGLKSVGRTAVHDVCLYIGGVLLPLGVVLLIAWAVSASREKHQQAKATRRGFEVLSPEQSGERPHL